MSERWRLNIWNDFGYRIGWPVRTLIPVAVSSLVINSLMCLFFAINSQVLLVSISVACLLSSAASDFAAVSWGRS
jgi:hypothetical protein